MRAMSKRLPEFQDCATAEKERLTGGDYCSGRNLVCYASGATGGIAIKNLETGELKLVTAGGRGECSPAFSPDGASMLFLSVIPGSGRQVFRYQLDSGELRQVTKIRGAAMEPQWSPDGKRILFSMITGGAGKKTQAPKGPVHEDDAVVIEDFGYKFDGMGFIRPDTHWHLFCVSAEGSEPQEARQLTDGEYDFMHAAWSPDGTQIVCVSNRFRSRQEGIGYDLLLIDAEQNQGKVTRLSKGYWIVSYPNPVRPAFLPDGSAVIAGVLNPEYAEDDSGYGYPEVYLYRFDAKTGEAKQVFESDEACYQCVQFPYNANCGRGLDKLQISEDGRYAYYVAGWKGQGNIYCLDLQGDGHAKLLAGGKQVYHGLGKVQNGRMLVTKSETTMPEAYYIMDVKTGELLQKAVQSAQQLVDEVELSMPEDFFFDTLDGESRVHGFVLPPCRREDGKKYPTILYIHGGPHPFYTYGLTMEFQMFAAQGFGVLYCNPRGSSGYGWTHQNCARSTDGSAYYDLLQFTDEAAKRFDWIDPERIGVTGGSYGGYMTNYMAVHAKKFKAYIAQRSIANELTMYANSDMQGRSTDYCSYEDFMVAKLKESAVSYAERVDKPILFLHGTEDYRTPVEGAHQFYVAIKDLHPDLPVRLVLFPHTGHEQPSDPRLLKRYYQEMTDWFKKYL